MDETLKSFIIGFIIIVIMLSIFYIYFAKQSNSLTEKILLVITCLTQLIVYLLYVLDYYNIPTLFKLTNGIDTKTWMNCIFMLISSILGGAIVLVSTRWQIEQVDKKERERNKGEFRIDKYKKVAPVDRIKIKYFLGKEPDENRTKKAIFIENVGKTSINEFYIAVCNPNVAHFEVEKAMIEDSTHQTFISYYNKIKPNETLEIIFEYDKEKVKHPHCDIILNYIDDYNNYYSQGISMEEWEINSPYKISYKEYYEQRK